jgi:hypothetical protein
MSTVKDAQDVLLRLRRSILRDIRVSLPCTVESYDASKCSVTVQPGIRDLREQEDGTYANLRMQPLTNVPVHFPGAGGYRITFPIEPGDTGYVVFADRSIDRWLSGAGGEVDVNDLRAHDLSDGIAFEPGVRPFGSPWSGASTSRMTLGRDGGPQVTFGTTDIQLGGNDQAVAKATAVASAITAVVNAIKNAADFNAAKTALTLLTAPSVGSSTVKVQD